MRNFYNAFGLLAVDNELRQAVTKHCGFTARPDLELSAANSPFQVDFHWEQQPNPANLDAIRSIFRERGVFLYAYDLAEINRLLARPELCAAIDTVGDHVRTSLQLSHLCDSRILVAVGALMVDKTFLAAFLQGEEHLTDPEFGLTDVLDQGLANLFTSAVVNGACGTLGDGGWPGTTCAIRVRPWVGMIHFNV